MLTLLLKVFWEISIGGVLWEWTMREWDFSSFGMFYFFVVIMRRFFKAQCAYLFQHIIAFYFLSFPFLTWYPKISISRRVFQHLKFNLLDILKDIFNEHLSVLESLWSLLNPLETNNFAHFFHWLTTAIAALRNKMTALFKANFIWDHLSISKDFWS